MNKHLHALALAAFLSACGGNALPTNDNIAADHSGESSPMVEPSEAPVVPFGQVANGPGFEFTIKAVEQRTSIGSSRQAAVGETFVVIKFTFKNTSNEPVSSGGRPEMRLVDDQGRSYSDDSGAGLGLTGLRDAIDDTNPGVTTRVSAVWRLDKASFDKVGWKLVLSTEPPLRLALA